jgi:hypothetical protein
LDNAKKNALEEDVIHARNTQRHTRKTLARDQRALQCPFHCVPSCTKSSTRMRTLVFIALICLRKSQKLKRYQTDFRGDWRDWATPNTSSGTRQALLSVATTPDPHPRRLAQLKTRRSSTSLLAPIALCAFPVPPQTCRMWSERTPGKTTGDTHRNHSSLSSVCDSGGS